MSNQYVTESIHKETIGKEVREALVKLKIEDLESAYEAALNSRLCDLEELIDISPFM